MGDKRVLTKISLGFVAVLMVPVLVLSMVAQNAGALALGMNLISTGPVPPGTGGSNSSERPSISADGTKIAFSGYATDLIPGTTISSGNREIFLYDVVTGTTKLITAGPLGEGSNGFSHYAVISADGSKIAFMSTATDLVGANANGNYNVFVYDVTSGVTKLVTAGPLGDGMDSGWGWAISISADGSKIAFGANATDLVGANAGGGDNVFLYDATSNTTTLISKGAGLLGGDAPSNLPTVSADGSKVVFVSQATDLIAGSTTNSNRNVFLYDVATGTTSLITKGPSPYSGSDNGCNFRPVDISVDNNLIVFSSCATNLISGITANGNENVYLYNVATGVTKLVTAGASGVGGDNNSHPASISANGSVIGFASNATDLISGVTTDGSNMNVYTYDVATGRIELITGGLSGIGGDNGSTRPVFSASGCTITFHSYATDLISGVTMNGFGDVYAYGRCVEPTPSVPGPGLPNAGYATRGDLIVAVPSMTVAMSVVAGLMIWGVARRRG